MGRSKARPQVPVLPYPASRLDRGVRSAAVACLLIADIDDGCVLLADATNVRRTSQAATRRSSSTGVSATAKDHQLLRAVPRLPRLRRSARLPPTGRRLQPDSLISALDQPTVPPRASL